MLMQAPPIIEAIRSIKEPGKIINLTPAGKPLNGELACKLANEENLTIICGRYEGVDARINDILALEEVSVGDAILNGGETASLAVIESVSRFIPGFLGKEESTLSESMVNGLLEYRQYTRPEEYEGVCVPQVLSSGNHAAIAEWQRMDALLRTLTMRPTLLSAARLDKKDATFLATVPLSRVGRNISFCLVHSPVRLENGKTGVSSLTNLDIHDIARISRSYGMGEFYVLTPLADQLNLLDRILEHWLAGKDTDRATALKLVRPVASFTEMEAAVRQKYGITPEYIATSAQWPAKGAPLTPENIRTLAYEHPIVICLGTARGLGREFLAKCKAQMRPLRFLGDNHLSVRSAAAIIADRILGDFC